MELGDCHTWNRYNTKGNRENQAFVDLNDEILAANKSAWDNPPVSATWTSAQKRSALELLQQNGQAQVFAFKDPRTLLVLDGWKDVCPQMEFIGVFRHPNAVAKSLESRSGMSRAQAIELWSDYNRRLLNQWKGRQFPLLCFDEPEEVFHSKLDVALDRLGLPELPKSMKFWEDSLRTSQRYEAARLPIKSWLLYKALKARSL
ncbi:hypothetical protein GCM10007053_15560 [Halioglobus pacificus]|uniref:Sulfotransferase family protein n=1 Tax=Parahalioglobus pacificus TaxID=930806 RepID=A0A919CJV0_9GAMM|nr:sulfotransferase family protein [Halioglobus pacificus]GHD31959.1 hypothetical protein GCM10007053_15560 [Halioglobus pacificus]